MSELDKKWKKFQKDYKLDNLGQLFNENNQSHIFEEDKLVLVDNFDEACESMMTLAVLRYAKILELATSIFSQIDQLDDLMKDSSDWKLGHFKFVNKDQWMANQDKIAQMDINIVTPRTIADVEDSTERYYVEIFNEKMGHLSSIKKNIDDLGIDVAHLMAHLTAIIDQPDQYVTISEDKNKGEVPF